MSGEALDLEAVKAALAGMTVAPWHSHDPSYGDTMTARAVDGNGVTILCLGCHGTAEDLRGSVILRNNGEAMVLEIERLRVADAGAREAVEAGYQTAVRLRAEVAYLKDREESIIAACDRVADGGKYRADIVSAVQRIRSGREEARAALAQQRDVYEEQARGHEAEIATLHAKLAAAAHEELRACSRIAVDLYAAGKQDDIAQALVSRQVHAQGRAS